MIDIGAHTGFALKHFVLNNFDVFAFEPIEQNRKKLIESFRGFSNLHIFSEAISNKTGFSDFHIALNDNGTIHDHYHSLEKLPDDSYHKKGKVIKVNTVTINDLVSSCKIPKQVGYLKIDVEGHDLKVLQASNMLKCEVICVEYWSDKHPLGISPSPPPKMIELLSSRGFSNFITIRHQNDIVDFSTNLTNFDDDSWGNILFFYESSEDIYRLTLEFCRKISKVKITNPMFSFLKEIIPEKSTFIDVGANVGYFTESVLEHFQDIKGILFEPTKDCYQTLKEKFKNNKNIEIVNSAVDSNVGVRKFYITKDSAQNSLLQLKSYGKEVVESEVITTSLDNHCSNLKSTEKIFLIKIDSQGNDLNILEGALEIIKKYKPIIITEFIFVELYNQQCSYYDQFEFFNKINYKLVGIYNSYSDSIGNISFADLVFIPNKLHKVLVRDTSLLSNFKYNDIQNLVEENNKLFSICEERLELINALSAEAEKRLKIINELDNEIKRLKNLQ
ncbi:MAG: FkbM family methyltransferase [Actinobacteria bacterium]|nr:FkbM family methyltransferase [Actinomycetota bacterium]